MTDEQELEAIESTYGDIVVYQWVGIEGKKLKWLIQTMKKYMERCDEYIERIREMDGDS